MAVKRITHTGRLVDLQNFSTDDVDIKDIAHSLSLTCRFSGHTPQFYSVAEHSILVSEHSGNYAREGLLHDAAEAYLGDIASPIKRLLFVLGGEFVLLEAEILMTIFRKFELNPPDEVLEADRRMLSTEAYCLFRSNPHWRPWKVVDPYPDVELTHPMSPKRAEAAFLKRAKQLGLC